ncbi:ABC transporter permease [Persicobacter diffluens]|uniref:ABC transporter permease n=1 Tax=Persicobacter diffluens TaxID=981 RepID=A0AAN4W340_9BACT|nr:ABC transporter permease [Persicobacter diffluens]
MFIHYLLTAYRNLKRNIFYSALSVLGFATGFTTCIIIGLFILQEFQTDKHFPDHHLIYRLYDAEHATEFVDMELVNALTTHFPEIESAAAYNGIPCKGEIRFPAYLKTKQSYLDTDYFTITENDFFKIFGIKILEGNPLSPFQDKNSVILTTSTARKLFGDESPLGKVVSFMVGQELIISAVCEDLPTPNSFSTDFFLNVENPAFIWNRSCENNKCMDRMEVYFKIKAGADPQRVEQKIRKYIPQLSQNHHQLAPQLLSDIYLSSRKIPYAAITSHTKANTRLIYTLWSTGLIILLLSITNYLNFNIARMADNARTLYYRKIAGASRHQVFLYLFTEIGIVTLLAFFLAVCLSHCTLPWAEILLNTPLKWQYLLLPHALIIFTVCLLAMMVIICLPPMWIAYSPLLKQASSGQNFGKLKQINQGLTVFQFSVAFTIMACLLMLNKQMRYIQNSTPGFNKEAIVYIPIQFNKQIARPLFNEIEKSIPGIQLSLSSSIPAFPVSTGGNTALNDAGEMVFTSFEMLFADENFLKLYNIPLQQNGEYLQSSRAICYINETGLQASGWKNTEGKIMDSWGTYPIGGVIGDFHSQSFHKPINPLALIIEKGVDKPANSDYNYLSIKLPGENQTEALKKIKEICTNISPNTILETKFLDLKIQQLYEKDERMQQSIFLFSMISLILLMLGILGQVHQICLKRAKEIGIRKVNGASSPEILLLLFRSFALQLIIGFFAGLPFAIYFIGQWLSNFVYRTSHNAFIYFLAAGIIAFFVLMLVALKGYSAAALNPVKVLKEE